MKAGETAVAQSSAAMAEAAEQTSVNHRQHPANVTPTFAATSLTFPPHPRTF